MRGLNPSKPGSELQQTMSTTTTSTVANTEPGKGLYFQIVCDPGHERTVRELRQLPKESRERVWADMTGDPSTTYYSINPEDPSFIAESLGRMNEELRKIESEAGAQLPHRMAPELSNDSAFQLAFLRAEEFDPVKAAQRLVRHFEQKKILFGVSKLGSKVCLSDLSKDDLESLSSGALQLLAKRDRANRIVLFSRYRAFVYKDRGNLVSGK